MSEKKHVEQWKEEIFPALVSKKEELVLMGYSDVTTEDIWTCLKDQMWNKNPEKKLYEVVQDILHLPSQTYMNYLTLNVLQQDDELASTIASITELLPMSQEERD